jgi:hypothetical protein
MCVFVREPLWRLNPKKGGEVWNAGGDSNAKVVREQKHTSTHIWEKL